MPIAGSTPQEALRGFADHLNTVLSRTVTQTRLVQFTTTGGMQLAFRQAGRATAAPLHTRFGPVGLYIGQVCDTEPVGRDQYQLQTIAYTYTLTPEAAPEPILRWEYVRQPDDPGARWCRHHIQGPVPLQLGPTTLNDLHLPTGWVTIEEILRFCIVDLGVDPLSDQWHEILSESYERFKREFAPRGSL